MSRITTHVLDTARGRPAAGVPVRLDGPDGLLGEAVTDDDGRVKRHRAGASGAGDLPLTFDVAAYDEDSFFPEVAHRPSGSPTTSTTTCRCCSPRSPTPPTEGADMAIRLGANQYGKAENRVVRIHRDTARHEITRPQRLDPPAWVLRRGPHDR